MTNTLQIFENHNFGSIRTVLDESGKALFCGKDIAEALGYMNPTKAIREHCNGGLKRTLTDALGRQQEATFIPEGDVYRLIISSKLPSAEKFERWVFDEVLPAIRFNDSQVRIIDRDGEPWWVAKDVCDVLELTDARKSVELLDKDERNIIPVTDALGREQNTYIINEPGIVIENNRPVVSSRKVAEVFEKEHKHVMESIRELECDTEFSQSNFRPSTYISDRGKEYPEYLMTRLGFALLAMGFTGAKAMQWQSRMTKRIQP